MARQTHGATLTINENTPDFPAEWGKHEFVITRTLRTQWDAEWINRHSSTATLDEHAQNGVRVEMDGVAAMAATVAKMVLRWGLTQPATDSDGNPIQKDDRSFVQVPIELPNDLEKRLEVVRELHEEDVMYIFGKIMEKAPKPMGETEKKDTVISATAPISMS